MRVFLLAQLLHWSLIFTGNRYLTLKVNALETLVAALVPDQDEMPFEEFIDSCLYDRAGIVVSKCCRSWVARRA